MAATKDTNKWGLLAKLESAYDPQTWLESHEDLYHAIRRQRGGGDELR